MNTDPSMATAWAEMQHLMKTAEGRQLTREEADTFDTLEATIRDARARKASAELGEDFAAVRIQPMRVEGASSSRSHDGGIRVLKPEERFASTVQGETYGGAGLTIRGMLAAALSGDWDAIPPESRAMAVGVGSAGGFAVPAPLSAVVIDRARNAARIFQAGALTVPMDSSTMKIARVATDPAAGWKLENAAATASDMTLESITLTARTLMAYVKSSVELIEDTSGDIGDVIENALAQALALELDRAALRGSGTPPEPLGIRNTTGVAIQSLGANGAAPTYAALSTAIQTVRAANFEPNAIIYSPRTAGTLDRLTDSTGQPLQPPPSVEAMPLFVTGQIPENLTAGTATTASEIYVGQWNHLLVGMRQRLVIEASREASDLTDSAFRQLQVHIRAYLRCDVAVSQPGAFAVITGVL